MLTQMMNIKKPWSSGPGFFTRPRNFLIEEGMEMKKGKKVFCEFILPFVVSQALLAGCCAGWVYLWVNM